MRHWAHPLIAAAWVQFRTSMFGFFSPWVLFKHGRNHVTIKVFFPTHFKRLVFQLKACWIKLNFSLRWLNFPKSDVHTEIC